MRIKRGTVQLVAVAGDGLACARSLWFQRRLSALAESCTALFTNRLLQYWTGTGKHRNNRPKRTNVSWTSDKSDASNPR
jgi:hypothetical protein